VKSFRVTASGSPWLSQNWEAVQKRLLEERKEALPKIDTGAAIAEFNLAFRTALSARPIAQPAGLIEQQACFASLRKSTRKVR